MSWSARAKIYLRNLCAINYQLRKGAWLQRSFTLSTINSSLLSDFLKLLADYRSVKAIDGDACHAKARD
jgi:hypothetical protein